MSQGKVVIIMAFFIAASFGYSVGLLRGGAIIYQVVDSVSYWRADYLLSITYGALSTIFILIFGDSLLREDETEQEEATERGKELIPS